MADATAYTDIIVEGWAPRITEIFDNSAMLARWLEKDRDSLVGETFNVPVHASRNEGIGARSERGTLPSAGEQGFKKAQYSPKHIWAQFTLTEFLLELAEKDEKEFIKALQNEVEGTITDVAEDRDRMFWGDGTGLLATLGTTTTSTTVVCTDTRFIRANMRVDILVKSTGAVTNGGTDRKVLSVIKNTSFVIDGDTVSTDSTYGVYRAGNKVLTTHYEPNGIQNLVDDTGAFGVLNPGTAGEEFWAASDTGSVGTLDENDMQTAWDAPAESGWKSSNEKLIVSTQGGRRAYADLLITSKQYNVATTRDAKTPSLKGGYDALDYNGSDFVAERKCPEGHIYFLDRQYVKLYQTAAPGWKKRDGRILKDDGGTGYRGVYRSFENLGTNHRAAHARLTGVTEL